MGGALGQVGLLVPVDEMSTYSSHSFLQELIREITTKAKKIFFIIDGFWFVFNYEVNIKPFRGIIK